VFCHKQVFKWRWLLWRLD